MNTSAGGAGAAWNGFGSGGCFRRVEGGRVGGGRSGRGAEGGAPSGGPFGSTPISGGGMVLVAGDGVVVFEDEDAVLFFYGANSETISRGRCTAGGQMGTSVVDY